MTLVTSPAGLILIITFITTVFFQNCSEQGAFEATDPSELQSSSGVVEFDADNGDDPAQLNTPTDGSDPVGSPNSSTGTNDDDSGNDTGDNSGSTGTGGNNPQPPANCGVLDHGQSQTVTRYRTATVPAGSTCVSQQQTQTCTDGTLSAFSPNDYQFLDCQVEPEEAPCGNLDSGESETRVRYETSSVPFGQACAMQTQTRTCNNGALSDFTPNNFTVVNCSPEPPANCGEVAHGASQTRTRYMTATVPNGESCVEQVQTQSCTNGVLSAFSPNTATFENCTQDAPPTPPASCGSIAHGDSESRTRYETTSVPFVGSCSSETQTRSCSDGELSEWSPANFSEVNCDPKPPANCTAEGLAHDQTETRVRYQSASVSSGSTCQKQVQSRTCTNGTASDWTPNNFTYETCSVAPAQPTGVTSVVESPLTLVGNPTYTLNIGNVEIGLDASKHTDDLTNFFMYNCNNMVIGSSEVGQGEAEPREMFIDGSLVSGCAEHLTIEMLNDILANNAYWHIKSVVHVKGNLQFDGVIFVQGGS